MTEAGFKEDPIVIHDLSDDDVDVCQECLAEERRWEESILKLERLKQQIAKDKARENSRARFRAKRSSILLAIKTENEAQSKRQRIITSNEE